MSEGQVIAALMGAVAAMWGFVIWLFRWALSRAEKRIDVLESREGQTLLALVENVKTLGGMMNTLLEVVREVRQVLLERGGGRDRT